MDNDREDTGTANSTADSTTNTNDEENIIEDATNEPSEEEYEVDFPEEPEPDDDHPDEQEEEEEEVVLVHQNIFEHYENLHDMIAHGTGVYGHARCKLEILQSTIPNAGFGVFLRAGCRMYRNEIVTQYSGNVIQEGAFLTSAEKDRTFSDGNIIILGKTVQQLVPGDGFGSIINSSHYPERPSNVRCSLRFDDMCITAMIRNEYIQGPAELFMAYGTAYWARKRREAKVIDLTAEEEDN